MAKYRFGFNLLPKQTKQDIEREEKKSNSLLYAAILLFGSALIWIGIRTFDAAVLYKNVKALEKTKIEKQQTISTYSQYRIKNGELVLKTDLLSSVVAKHIDPDLVFDLMDQKVKTSTPEVVITGYGRTQTGSFQLQAETANVNDVSTLLQVFFDEESVVDTNLERLSKIPETNKYSFVLDISIVVKDEQIEQ